jgi:predicted ATPase with chaperone activity
MGSGPIVLGSGYKAKSAVGVLSQTCSYWAAQGARRGWCAGCVTTRPCRSPHQTMSDAGLIGGGQVPLPGEESLAQRGLLFVDELPECQRHVLEGLHQPLEEGVLYSQSRERPRS